MSETTAKAPAERLEELLTTIVEALEEPAKVEVEETEDELYGRIKGQELGLLIGRNGQTVDAIQHIARRAVFRGEQERKRVMVDVGGYRERRDEQTRRLAERAARQATRYGREVSLDAMPPTQRRVAHEFLRDWENVETHSEGREPQRYLVVTPIEKRRRSRSSRRDGDGGSVSRFT